MITACPACRLDLARFNIGDAISFCPCCGRKLDNSESAQYPTDRLLSQNLASALFNEMLDGLAVHEIICDPAGTPVDYRFLAVNPAFETLTGVKAADIIGKTVLETLPDTEQYWIETYGRVALSGSSIHFEQYARGLDKYFEVSAFCCSPGQFVCVFHDITASKRALEALSESERRFRSYVENASDIVFSISPNGLITYLSPNWLKYVGIPPEDGIGRPFEEFVHPEDKDRCRECIRNVLNGRSPSGEVEYRIRHRDGSWRWHISRGSALRDEKDNIIGGIGIARDVSEARQLQNMLRDERDVAIRLAQTETLEDALQLCALAASRVPYVDAAGIYLINDETGSFKLMRAVGASDEFASKTSEYSSDSDQARLIMRGQPIHCAYKDFPVSSPASQSIRSISVVPLRHHGRIIGSLNAASYTAPSVIQHAQDMLETIGVQIGDTLGRLQDANRLDESRKRLVIAADAAKLGVWDWDIVKNRLICDARVFQIYGIEPPVIPFGIEIWENAIHPDDKNFALSSLQSALSGEKDYDIEFRILRPDGSMRMIRGRGQVIRDSHGNPVRMIGVNSDVTEIKQIEERLLIMEKMDTIGQLAGGIAHDFNNQLTGIMGYVGILQTMVSDPKSLGVIDRILTIASRSADLTRQLLNFARKGTPRIVSTDVHDIIAEVAGILEHSIDRRIKIIRTLNAEPSRIDGDPSHLQTALLNLALNACDAMPNGGRLEFRTETIDSKTVDRPFLFDLPGGLCVCVSVIDSGDGISESIRDKIFDPFFTTKEHGKGVGLGLSVVYGTVQSHRGAIDLISAPGAGSEFRLLFTVGSLKNKSVADRRDIRATSSATILVVDDEYPIRITLSFILRQAGYTVITAEDGVEGINAYQTALDSVDLIILDLNMPRMNGRDVFFQIRKINPEARILVSSGYSSENVNDILRCGRCGFISKPYQRNELLTAILDILEQ